MLVLQDDILQRARREVHATGLDVKVRRLLHIPTPASRDTADRLRMHRCKSWAVAGEQGLCECLGVRVQC